MQAHEQACSKHKQDGKRLCGICHVECVARLGGEQEREKEIYVEQILVVSQDQLMLYSAQQIAAKKIHLPGNPSDYGFLNIPYRMYSYL